MKRMAWASLFLLSACAAVAGQVKLVVKTGMSPKPDALVSAPVALKGALEVRDADGRSVPCAVRTDPSGNRFVAFRIRNAGMLELLDYTVIETKGLQGDLPDVPKTLPGMNLFTNADFSARDANGDIDGWAPSPKGYGIKSKWTDEDRRNIRAKDGMLGLRGEMTCLVTYVYGLEAGHVYRIAFDGKCEKGVLAATMWFQGDNGRLPNDFIKGVGNYKNSNGVSASGEWEHVENSSFIYFDEAAKHTNMNCRELLPGTGSAYFYFYVKNGRGAVRNLRLEDITSDSGVRAEIVE